MNAPQPRMHNLPGQQMVLQKVGTEDELRALMAEDAIKVNRQRARIERRGDVTKAEMMRAPRHGIRDRAIEFIRRAPRCTAQQVADALGREVSTIRNQLNLMARAGYITRRRRVRSGPYLYEVVK